jgi:hypothetical protein
VLIDSVSYPLGEISCVISREIDVLGLIAASADPKAAERLGLATFQYPLDGGYAEFDLDLSGLFDQRPIQSVATASLDP